MNKITKKMLASILLLTASVSFAQSRMVPSIIAVYAENIVNIEICKLHKIDIKPMDQRKVLKKYIEMTGSQTNFVQDVRSYTSSQMEIISSLNKEQQINLCKAKARIDKEIEAILAPKKPQPEVNPLDR